ncbi:GNAT family N-acetyltransferase [Methanogenium marinum]|uniref:GNAT family N-acetyltransferase n=1 Tax=Methanogenium marinum TaxID=348610 RepID=A0A9Q4KU73_9EURY|nr:GNAT family N-acetyltransferase [Methanogenium marinum]MDE4907326.1 GNAT family N-acetyltransferase [Methanogenium marinum]
MMRMQKILVEWDTKLFSKNVFEIQNTDYFNKNELKEVDESCYTDNAFMSFIKLNNNDFKKIHYLEECGFNYMESQYELKKVLTQTSPVLLYSRHCVLQKLDYSDLKAVDEVIKIITTTFDTDRYFLDPKFDKKYSGLRYKNWFLNSFHDEKYETYVYISKTKGDIIGFSMIKNESYDTYMMLGGVSEEYKGYGFMVSMVNDYLNYAFSKGMKTAYTSISSHNLDVFNIYIHLGFRLTDEKIVMRKMYE